MRNRTSHAFLTLRRRQLDARLGAAAFPAPPRDGWIKSIRTALGMSASQLGRRLRISQQGALDLERREREESITVAKLRQVASALGCELHFALVPKPSLEETVQQQAVVKARDERDRIAHTMRLEAQEEGVEGALAAGADAASWTTTRIARLWD